MESKGQKKALADHGSRGDKGQERDWNGQSFEPGMMVALRS